MFSKLKGSTSCSPTPSEKILPPTPIDTNPISELFEVGRQVASAGPELAWKIYDATRRCDEKEASVFFFDKRWADRLLSGSKRREVIVDVLRRGVTQLENLQHQRILTVIQSLVETNDTMAFATEPVLGSLANILGCLEDRLRQGVPSFLREYTFSEFEHTYGLLQMTEALGYLHFSCRIIHRGICPQSVIVNKKGTWKLAGLEFTEKACESDLMLPVSCQPYTSKLPKMCQPDLDFLAPEIQSSSACSPQSDMFSLGLLICSIYNNGRSPIESNFSSGTYFKQLESLNTTASEIVERMPPLLKDSVLSMLEPAARKRHTSQNFATSRYFMDPGVHSLQYMDAIAGKDLGYRVNFYQNLRDVLNLIPKKMWFQHLIPSMEREVADHGQEGLATLLECVLVMASECTRDEYQSHLIPFLRNVFSICNKSIQATALLLENVDILIDKTARSDLQADILPLILGSFQTNSSQVQCCALKAISKVIDDLDDETIKQTVLPKAKLVFTKESDPQVQENALACIIRVLDHLDRSEIESDILPMLLQANLSESGIMMSTAKIYKHLLSERILQADHHSELLATKIMPSFFPVIVDTALQFDDFLFVSELLQEMFDMVTKYQRHKLKQEDFPQMDKLPVQFKMAIEAPSPTCPFADEVVPSSLSPSPTPFQFNVEAPSRRQSVCSEFVSNIMRATSPDSSPDIEDAECNPFLRVENSWKQRRHSDNSIQIPTGLNSASSTSNINKANLSSTLNPLNRARSSSSLAYSSNRRRHSSVNPHDLQRFATKLMDSAAESMVESVEKASKATSGMHLGLDSITSVKGLNPLPSPSRRGSRRCSVVDIITTPSCLSTTSSKPATKPSPKPSKKIFNKLGSEMQNLLKK